MGGGTDPPRRHPPRSVVSLPRFGLLQFKWPGYAILTPLQNKWRRLASLKYTEIQNKENMFRETLTKIHGIKIIYILVPDKLYY